MEHAIAQEIGSVCLGLHVRRAARRITRLYDLALLPVDLTIGQFSLMTMLAAQEFWALQPLADALGSDRTSLTAALKPLERRGLVASSSDAGDRRVRNLALTPAGSALMDEAYGLWREAQRRAEQNLGSETAASLRRTLHALA